MPTRRLSEIRLSEILLRAKASVGRPRPGGTALLRAQPVLKGR